MTSCGPFAILPRDKARLLMSACSAAFQHLRGVATLLLFLFSPPLLLR